MDYKERLQKLTDSGNGGSLKRTVKRVVDGDTFEVDRAIEGSVFVRIANYDAPEKNQDGYDKATKLLCDLIEGKEVTIDPKSIDRGRIVAEVSYNGRNVVDLLKKR